MIDSFMQGNWHDWKYAITVPLCVFVGYLIGYARRKEMDLWEIKK